MNEVAWGQLPARQVSSDHHHQHPHTPPAPTLTHPLRHSAAENSGLGRPNLQFHATRPWGHGEHAELGLEPAGPLAVLAIGGSQGPLCGLGEAHTVSVDHPRHTCAQGAQPAHPVGASPGSSSAASRARSAGSAGRAPSGAIADAPRSASGLGRCGARALPASYSRGSQGAGEGGRRFFPGNLVACPSGTRTPAFPAPRGCLAPRGVVLAR